MLRAPSLTPRLLLPAPSLTPRLLLPALLAACYAPALAVDHNNIDAGRPLDFDDAEAIALGERALEAGAAISRPRGGRTGIGGAAEFLYGFAPNSHLSIGLDPSLASANGERRRFDVGDVELSGFHNFNREVGRTPALSLRADAHLPTGRGSAGTDVRLRGIASRSLSNYGRLHLNLDLDLESGRGLNQRRLRPGLIVGYSRMLDVPRRFDRTLVAQLGVRASRASGQNPILNVGLGLRQQVTVRSVLDIGLASDILSSHGEGERFRLIAGYSTQF